MKVWHEEIPYDFSNPIINKTFTEQALFFDIETTGFSPARTTLYLIGCAARKGRFLIIDQFFAETPDAEPEVLSAFFAHIKNYDTLITFNGTGFDIPYLKGRCEQFHLKDSFAQFHNIDIFKEVSRLKFLLKLPNYRQKSVENFLGIDREDTYNGGELIEVYHSYVKSPTDEACRLLKLHNYEDVLDMPQLLPILSYPELFCGNFAILSLEGNEYTALGGTEKCKELLFKLQNDFSVPCKVSCACDNFYLTADGEKTFLRVGLCEAERKYFFPDYKNYYYLPDEDIAVPKSVASGVDKAHRKNATAATCYQRKYAIFLPQYEDIITPAFREKYNDKKSYFELTEDFVTSKELQHRYLCHVLKRLSNQKNKR